MVCNYIYLSNKTSDYIVPLTTKMIVFDGVTLEMYFVLWNIWGYNISKFTLITATCSWLNRT